MLPYPIVAAQVDAKSPVDEQLMDSIRLDLDYLDTQLGLQGSFDYQFKLNGYLPNVPTVKRKRIDGVLISKPATFQQCRAYLEEPGDGGTLEIDVRRVTRVDAKISALTRQFTGAINSIARVGSPINTQSVTRATAQITTQSIVVWKSTINISTIVSLGDNLWRYNLASAPDSDWKVGDSVKFASATSGANNGTFVIVKINDDGGANIVVENASGVEQSSAAGNAQLQAFQYNYINPVNAQFVAGEKGLFAGHTSALNDGTLLIYATNNAGNNVIVKNPIGVTQGSAAGTLDVLRWLFSFTAPAPSDYVVGEKAETSGHTSANNDGKFFIRALNTGGNNLVLYNENGVTQGGVAGTVNTLRWGYFFSTDPASGFIAGQFAIVTGATSAVNSGTFEIKQVDRTTADNLIIYNENGVAQGGAAGTLVHRRMLVKFASDQSATITTDSRMKIYGSAQALTDGDFDVVEVNRGGGANYNAVIESPLGVPQVGAAGRVVTESKSLFDTRPSFIIPPLNTGFSDTHMKFSSNAVFNATRKIVPSDTLVEMELITIPEGKPKNLVVQLL
jgi:hypothetical protein